MLDRKLLILAATSGALARSAKEGTTLRKFQGYVRVEAAD